MRLSGCKLDELVVTADVDTEETSEDVTSDGKDVEADHLSVCDVVIDDQVVGWGYDVAVDDGGGGGAVGDD